MKRCTIGEAAEILNVSDEYVERLIEIGTLKGKIDENGYPYLCHYNIIEVWRSLRDSSKQAREDLTRDSQDMGMYD